MNVRTISIESIPCVRAAAVELLGLAVAHPENDDEYGRKAGQVISDCIARLGMPDVETQNLTPRQQLTDDVVTDTIQDLASKMQSALVRARLLPKEN